MSDKGMTGTASNAVWNKLGRLGLPTRAALVFGCALVLWLLLAPLAYTISGPMGLAAAAVGAGLCVFGAELALAIAACFRGPAAAMYGMMLGMLVRMTIPLILGVTLQLKSSVLAEAGMVFYLLAFYMVTLAVETV